MIREEFNSWEPVWRRLDAIELIAKLEPLFAAAGWHLALTGSVLYKGSSNKDLDLVCYPHKAPANPRGIARVLEKLGWSRRASASAMRDHWALKGGRDEKHVEVWYTDDDRRVDVMVLQ